MIDDESRTRTLLAELIALPSVSATSPERDMPNRAVIDRLANVLEQEGFEVAVLPVSDDGKKANLVATRGRGPGGLVLSGHTDTVPCDAELWQSDPFVLTERDGALFGLGTADMKGFFPLAIAAARRFRDEDLRAPLTILATADEECGMSGVRALVDAGYPKQRYAVIGEPTGLRPVRMHKGVSFEWIELLGRSGHSSDPSLGVSALDGMSVALDEIRRFRDELRGKTYEGLTPPYSTLNLGRIEGGDNPNRICGHCRLEFDLRLIPGLDIASLRSELHARIARAIAEPRLGFRGGPMHEPVMPFETPSTSAIVRAAEAFTGVTAEAVAFGTEAPFFSARGVDTIVLGPGDIAVAHQPNECLPLDRLRPTITLLAELIERFCVNADDVEM